MLRVSYNGQRKYKSLGLSCSEKFWNENKQEVRLGHPMARSMNTIIKSEIDKYNKELSKAENVMKFEILADEWTQENGLLTPTLKVKRSKISKKYAGLIQAMFDHA